MDITKLKRDASKVHACLKELDDNTVVATQRCRIYLPENYVERKLAFTGAECWMLGIYCIADETGAYGVSSATSMIRTNPSVTNTVIVNEEKYLEFIYEPGDCVIADTQVVKSDSLLYQIYIEFVAKGNVPWYMNYQDQAEIFRSALDMAGVSVGANHAVVEMIISTMCRSPEDRAQYYRHFIKTLDDIRNTPPVYIPFRSVTYGATNTTSKLIGAYFSDGLDSALANPSKRVEKVEQLLRA